MGIASNGSADVATILIFENDPRQALAYQELFVGAGYEAQTALPDQAVQQLCEQLQPQAVLFDMGIWEADTAYVFGILNGSVGFARPGSIALGRYPTRCVGPSESAPMASGSAGWMTPPRGRDR